VQITMKQILFISYDGLTDPLGQSQILPYLLNLTKYGYAYTILSCEKPARYESKKDLIESIIKPYPVQWVPLMYHKSPPVLSSVYDYEMLWKAAKKLQKQKGFQLVHTRSGIPTLVALRLKKKFGVKFLNDVRGFWADERADGGLFDLKNPVYRSVYGFFKRKEAECFRVNDYTTCLTFKAKDIIQSWKFLKEPANITVIPCSVDLELFDPANYSQEEADIFKNKLGIKPGEKVVSYLGSVGTWYMIDEMLELFTRFLHFEPSVKFLMLINGGEHEMVNMYLQKHSLPKEKFILTEASRKEVPLYLKCCDYSVFFIKPCFSKLSSSPTKHAEIMAMGLPLITNSGVGDVAEIVKNYESGEVIDSFTIDSYDVAIKTLLNTAYDKAGIRKGAYEVYSLDGALKSYAAVYKKLTGEKELVGEGVS
jgi:glycosyltransferase involved in cell wall biosynthesis